MTDISLYIFVSMVMLVTGLIGVLSRRNTLIFFLSIELMLNAANLLFVAFARQWGNQLGHVWVFFVLVVAAAEAAVGLAIIINLSRTTKSVDVDQYDRLKG
jgi:NADH-quinone oxidoreductase subunit K